MDSPDLQALRALRDRAQRLCGPGGRRVGHHHRSIWVRDRYIAGLPDKPRGSGFGGVRNRGLLGGGELVLADLLRRFASAMSLLRSILVDDRRAFEAVMDSRDL